jgi:hypothetical protein
MLVKNTVVLYSQNSQKSKELLSMLSSRNYSLQNITPVCIDDPKIRERVLSSRNIRITVVPTVLILYFDGGVEQYDGSMAFSFLESSLVKNSKEEEEEDDEEEQVIVKPSKSKHKKKRRPAAVEETLAKHGEHTVTNISDLPDLEEFSTNDEIGERSEGSAAQGSAAQGSAAQNGDDSASKKRMPIGIRSNAGNYEIIEPVDSVYNVLEEETAKRTVVRGIKSSSDKNDKKDIMSLAQAMQKDRDAEVENLSKQPPPIV